MSEANSNTAIAYDGSIVDLSDIPEVKSFKGWRSGLQDENISVKELSRLAMAEQKA